MKGMIKNYRGYFKFLLIILLFTVLSGCCGVTPTSYTVTATAGAGGSINPSGAIVVSEGENQTFTIIPDEGYQITDVLVDGASVGPVGTYTFVNVNQDHTIQASFILGPSVYNTDTAVGYDTIQAAIDAALSGETIVVYPGIYMENIAFDGKGITVRSTDPVDPAVVAATIINGGENDSVVKFTGGDTSTLAGFTIQNGDASYGGGIYVEESSPTIENNTITGNTAGRGGGGIDVFYNSSPTITGNVINGNTSADHGGGISVSSDSELLPATDRPTGWGTGRENIPIGDPLARQKE